MVKSHLGAITEVTSLRISRNSFGLLCPVATTHRSAPSVPKSHSWPLALSQLYSVFFCLYRSTRAVRGAARYGDSATQFGVLDILRKESKARMTELR